MPTTESHLLRAQQNLQFAQSFNLDTTPYMDWVVAAYFYAALHLIEALLFEKDKLHGDPHERRKELIKEKSYLWGIKDEYFTLKDKSEDARYRNITFTRRKIEQEIIPPYQAIESHVRQQLPPKK